jgi:hypothetical protein
MVGQRENYIFPKSTVDDITAGVFRRDSPPTRNWGSICSGGESYSMLASMEGNAVQAFSKGNNLLPYCVA